MSALAINNLSTDIDLNAVSGGWSEVLSIYLGSSRTFSSWADKGTQWTYKGTEERHIGPDAEDFYRAFGCGTGGLEDDSTSYTAVLCGARSTVNDFADASTVAAGPPNSGIARVTDGASGNRNRASTGSSPVLTAMTSHLPPSSLTRAHTPFPRGLTSTRKRLSGVVRTGPSTLSSSPTRANSCQVAMVVQR